MSSPDCVGASGKQKEQEEMSVENICEFIRQRERSGRRFSLVVSAARAVGISFGDRP